MIFNNSWFAKQEITGPRRRIGKGFGHRRVLQQQRRQDGDEFSLSSHQGAWQTRPIGIAATLAQSGIWSLHHDVDREFCTAMRLPRAFCNADATPISALAGRFAAAKPQSTTHSNASRPSGHGCQPRVHGWAVTRRGVSISILENWALREWGARRRPFSTCGGLEVLLGYPIQGAPQCASCSQWLPPTTNHHVIVISGSRFSHIIGQGCTNSVLPIRLVISYAIIITFICGVHCRLIVALRFSNLLIVFSPRFTGRSPKRSESCS